MGLCENQESHFQQNLLEKIKYTEGKSGDIQYILEKYLYYKQKGAGKFAKPTIEHIVPQDNSDEIFKKFNCDKKEIIKKINQIGNLTILEESENSSVFNKPFSEKKSSYRKHLFVGNQNILDYSFQIQPEEAIQKRGEEIAVVLYKIFLAALETGKWKKEQN